MKNEMTTNRLLLVPLESSDGQFIIELLNSDGWVEFIGDRNVHSENDAEVYIQKILDNPINRYWTIKLKESKKPIGIITLIKRGYLEHHDIGFALLPEYGKFGFAYEASKHVLEELISSGLHTKILAITVKNNLKSIALLEKLGLEFESEIVEDNEVLMLYSIVSQKIRRNRTSK